MHDMKGLSRIEFMLVDDFSLQGKIAISDKELHEREFGITKLESKLELLETGCVLESIDDILLCDPTFRKLLLWKGMWHFEHKKYSPLCALPISRGLFIEGPCIKQEQELKLIILLS